MITLNGYTIEQGRFPDGTLSLNVGDSIVNDRDSYVTNWISCYYDGDDEIFTIMSLVDMLNRNKINDYTLYMPYLPNARMDRIKADNENFSLKVFANWINSLGFRRVIVENVHSNVSTALVDNIVDLMPENDINDITYKYDFEIQGLEIMGADVSGKNVLIIDDICSKGFTFYYAGQQLREHGATDVRLYITHCEDNIKNEELLKTDVISKVYTTDSICHIEDEKINFLRNFRK